MRIPPRFTAALATLALATAGCGSTTAPVASPTARGAVTGSITVLAAASLTAAFKAMGSSFEKAHPGAAVTFAFAGSPTLVAQLQQGAPGDVFASADQPNMQQLVDAGLVAGNPTIFARNRLEIVVAPGNPKGIASLQDLTRSGLVVVLCAPAVPCGRYGLQALTTAGVHVTPASQETDVKAVVSKVALGEADAGIVYVTDVRAAGSTVQGVVIPEAENVVASYPIALLKANQNTALARAFIGYVLSSDGQRALAGFGFSAP